jgi:hypothetical protein
MALNLVYADAGMPMLSKIKIGENVYYLKDNALRAIVEDFGAAVNYNVDAAVAAESANLITSGAVHKYVTDYVTEITGGAMTFVGMFEPEAGKDNKQVLAEKVPAPAAGYVAIVGTAEYVYVNSEAGWQLYGDEGIYATITGVESTYVKKAFTIADLALDGEAITADALKAALGINNLGALAFADKASGTISTIDTITGTAAIGGTYDVVQTAVQVPATYSALDVTPAGNITLTTETLAEASYDTMTGVSITASEVEDGGNYQPKGTISLPNITITHQPSTADVATVTDAGTGYTLSGGSVS